MVLVGCCETGKRSRARIGKQLTSFICMLNRQTERCRGRAKIRQAVQIKSLPRRSIRTPPEELVATARMAVGSLLKGETPSRAKYISSNSRPQVEARLQIAPGSSARLPHVLACSLIVAGRNLSAVANVGLPICGAPRPRLFRAVSQSLWPGIDREVWFSSGENHEKA
jgi:hypothetical protein